MQSERTLPDCRINTGRRSGLLGALQRAVEVETDALPAVLAKYVAFVHLELAAIEDPPQGTRPEAFVRPLIIAARDRVSSTEFRRYALGWRTRAGSLPWNDPEMALAAALVVALGSTDDAVIAERVARLGGVYLDTDVKPVRPLDEMCPPEVVAWAACEQLDIVTNAAMGFPPNHPAMWHAVAMVEESFFERRYVGDQAGPGLIARVVTQYDDVALYPPACFHPTVGESKTNPDAGRFLLAAHLFAGTWVEESRARHNRLWSANHDYGMR